MDSGERLSAIEATCKYFEDNLNDACLEYLSTRCVTPTTARHFRIGFAPPSDNRDALVQHLHEQGYTDQQINDTGLIYTDKRTGFAKELFSNRLVYPVFGVNGNVVKFTARDMSDTDQTKYLHSKGPIKNLYNEAVLYDETRQAVVLCEGINPVAAHECDVPAVGTLGKGNFKAEFAPLFTGKRVYLAPDNDDPDGIEAARRWASVLLPCVPPTDIYMTILPCEGDLTDYFKTQDTDDFNALIADSPNLLDYELQRSLEAPDGTPFAERFNAFCTVLSYFDSGTTWEYLRGEVKEVYPDFTVKRDLQSLHTLATKAGRERVKEERQAEQEAQPDKNLQVVYEAIDLPDGRIMVDILPDENSTFGFLNLKDGELSFDHYIRHGEEEIHPPQHNPDLANLPFNYGNLEMVAKAYEEQTYLDPAFLDLFGGYLQALVDLPAEQDWYTFEFIWVAHTYIQEFINHTPYIYMYADDQKGKTRNGQALTNTSFRGFITPSITEASYFRMREYWKPTIFYDAVDIKKELDNRDVADVLHATYSKGASIIRTRDHKKRKHENYNVFTVFGPLLLATNWDISATLESRCIQVPMQDSDRDFYYDVPDMLEMATEIKSVFLAFRAAVLSGQLELAEVRRPTAGRLGEALRPLYQTLMTLCPEKEDAFLELVTSVRQKKLNQRIDSIEGLALSAMQDVVASGGVAQGFIPLPAVMEAINSSVPADRKAVEGYKTSLIRRRVAKLGFDITRQRDEDTGERFEGIAYIPTQFNTLLTKYGLNTLPDDIPEAENDQLQL